MGALVILTDVHLVYKTYKIEFLSSMKVIFQHFSRPDLSNGSITDEAFVIAIVSNQEVIWEEIALVKQYEVGVGVLGYVDGDYLSEVISFIASVDVGDCEVVALSC